MSASPDLMVGRPSNLRSQRALILLLRFGAAILLLALLAVVMPLQMMMTTNAQLGLDPLPAKPIVAYLTRSLSALYAYHGLFLLYISFDVRRYLPLIRFIAWSTVGFGIFMLMLDPLVGMPWYWTAAEAPAIIAYGVVLLAVSKSQP